MLPIIKVFSGVVFAVGVLCLAFYGLEIIRSEKDPSRTMFWRYSFISAFVLYLVLYLLVLGVSRFS